VALPRAQVEAPRYTAGWRAAVRRVGGLNHPLRLRRVSMRVSLLPYSYHRTTFYLLGKEGLGVHREAVYSSGSFSPPKTFAIRFVWAGIPLLRISASQHSMFSQSVSSSGMRLVPDDEYSEDVCS